MQALRAVFEVRHAVGAVEERGAVVGVREEGLGGGTGGAARGEKCCVGGGGRQTKA